MKQAKGILFDLDGTLIDSAPNIFQTLLFLADKYELNVLPENILRPYIGEGLAKLIRTSNPKVAEHISHTYATEGFKHYRENAPKNTDLYDGATKLLEFLNTNHIPWGIVTNKLRDMTDAILNDLPILSTSNILICRDDLKVCKPNPYPLLKAASSLNLNPEDCIYLGDAKNDMLAAKNADMIGVIATYGYLPENIKEIDEWPHFGKIQHIKDISKWIII
ncbi:MAG: 2-phosphoglycolate phosphatase [Francisellaceae bacterium]|jgi:2-phosphoglycolate phosphatase